MSLPTELLREQWLNRFVSAARAEFEAIGFPLPEKLRVSIGFPSTGSRGKRIGECWSDKASADQHFEIFVHPMLQGESSNVADILTHELCHTATPGHGHDRTFKRCALAIGLTGKMTATVAGPVWHGWADPILDQLGPIPAANLKGMPENRKKQTTRLVKVECDDCGLIYRITAKHLHKHLACADSDCAGAVTVYSGE